MGIENKLTPTMAQAEYISNFAGIELTQEQKNHYASLRESTEEEIISLSDQKILYACLKHNQKKQFRERFTNIKF